VLGDTLGGGALLMRPAKTVLMALQLHHRAGEEDR